MATKDNTIDWGGLNLMVNELMIGQSSPHQAIDTTSGLKPATSDGAALGNTTEMWSDLFLASGAVINFNAGDVTLTHAANALAMAGGDLSVTGATTVTGALTTVSATAPLGYATGSGGTVTQATDKSTGVTLNKTTGQITMNNAALAAAAEVSFTVTNSAVAATDVIVLSIASGATAASYLLTVGAVGAGSFAITVSNCSGGSLSEAIVINFAVIKGVAA